MPTDQSRLKPPFDIPPGIRVVREGYRGNGDGKFHSYFSVFAEETKCVIPDGHDHVTISATLLTGTSKDDVASELIRLTLYKDGRVTADLGRGVLRWGTSEE